MRERRVDRCCGGKASCVHALQTAHEPATGGDHDVDVLLLDASCRQTLPSMRAYARAGLRVGLVSCRSEVKWAPSLRSRYCACSAAVPDVAEDSDRYADAVLRVVERHSAKLVVPAHDGSIEALRRRRAELEQVTRLGIANEAALGVAVDKTRTLALAADLGIASPVSIPVDDVRDLAPALHGIGLPAVLKPTESYARRSDGHGRRLESKLVRTVEEAEFALEAILEDGGRALLQQFVPGRREAVSLFYANGRFWARMAQMSYREVPLLGGASVLCETIPLLPDISAAAERLVRAIDLEGCSMVEFRRDSAGRPLLMEVNPRMGGSVALAIRAGVNFPRLLYDWKLGLPLHETTEYQVGQRLRWLWGDLRNLYSVLTKGPQPDGHSRTSATLTFLCDSVRKGNWLDLIDVHDIVPDVLDLTSTVQDSLRVFAWPIHKPAGEAKG